MKQNRVEHCNSLTGFKRFEPIKRPVSDRRDLKSIFKEYSDPKNVYVVSMQEDLAAFFSL